MEKNNALPTDSYITTIPRLTKSRKLQKIVYQLTKWLTRAQSS